MSKFRIFLFVILLLIVGIGWYISAGSYSDGERAGTVSKLSKRGYVFKTYEGVLNEGGYSGATGTLTPKYWDFSVLASKDSITAKLEEALRTGERVTLKYEEKFFQFPWNGDTKYFVVDVQFLTVRKPVEVVPQPVVATPAVVDSTKK
jgi:hypothetical protein